MRESESRRWLLGAVVCAAMVVPLGAVRASTDDVGQGMGERLKRGFADTFTGVIEWPVQTYKGWVRGCSFVNKGEGGGSKVTGSAIGLVFAGPAHAIGRTGSGVLELFGFWLPNPKDNEGVGTPLDAEFSWEMGESHSIFKPTFEEGIKPWGRKLVRGLGNGLGGILEFPGQIVKGARRGGAANVGKGVVKGVWFFLGREAYGVGDAVGFFLPNHPGNPGYAFEEEWPWDALSSK